MSTRPYTNPQETLSYRTLGDFFCQPCSPTPVARPQLIAFNQSLANELQLPAALLNEETAIALFAGNTVLEGPSPFCQAYAGHQFAHFNPRLGDGRAIMLLEAQNHQGELRDIQLKGAGRTPFSRGGDGRSPIGPVLREFIMSEAMYALGVPTTRALAAVVTGEWVQREQQEPGAILTRVASSHIRIGTFQFAAAHGGAERVKQLADYVIQRHYPECADKPEPYLSLLDAVIERHAQLIAHWMSLGFIHGVMNTDNSSVCGETIDYGPCAMMDQYDANQFYSFIDKRGRYRYSQQPHIAKWNLARFAECLIPLLVSPRCAEADAVETLTDSLESFSARYEQKWLANFSRKLGLSDRKASDRTLIEQLLSHFEHKTIDFTLGFRGLSAHLNNSGTEPEIYITPLPPAWHAQWLARLDEQGTEREQVRQQMNQVNPLVIPRNHHIQSVITAAQSEGDLRPFHDLLQTVNRPFDDSLKESRWAKAPAADEQISHTFCGT